MDISSNALPEAAYYALKSSSGAKHLSLAKREKQVNPVQKVKERLSYYGRHNTSAKERWLLSSHAHCFISLS